VGICILLYFFSLPLPLLVLDFAQFGLHTALQVVERVPRGIRHLIVLLFPMNIVVDVEGSVDGSAIIFL